MKYKLIKTGISKLSFNSECPVTKESSHLVYSTLKSPLVTPEVQISPTVVIIENHKHILDQIFIDNV